MTKLLQNKTIIKFLGIALSILLIVALVPQINIAYGSKDDVATDTPTAETDDNPVTEGEGGTTDTSEESNSNLGDIDPAAGAPEGGNSTGDEDTSFAVMSVTDEQAPEPTKARSAVRARVEPTTTTATIGESALESTGGNKTDSGGTLTLEGGIHTLTVKGTLERDIVVKGGATLTITGLGTIKGSGKGSVIVVLGKNTVLNYGTETEDPSNYGKKGPTVTGGTGTETTHSGSGNSVWTRCGGGIHVDNYATLNLKSGTIDNNKAITGGGIFIGTKCRFKMEGGKVSNNKTVFDELTEGWNQEKKDAAKNSAHEGGGIFYAGSSGEITAGRIEGNTTNTTFDWGGGGIFVNAESKLTISSARITNNTAEALGGGISGCPHAKIGIGTLTDGVAVFGNTAKYDSNHRPTNTPLSFLAADSTLKAGKKVGCGDYLALGIDADNGITYGKVKNGNFKALKGDYAKDKFTGRANDFYCTLASYISGIDMGSHKDGIAWIGYVAGVPAVSAPAANTTRQIKEADMTVSKPVSIPVGEAYVAPDASLGLTNTATSDNADRKVFIEKNYSTTHGGGIGCNGTLEFGTLPTEPAQTYNNYALPIKKTLISGVEGATSPTLKAGEFSFVLKESKNGPTVSKASNDASGNVIFEGLKGLRNVTQNETKTFYLEEEQTSGQITSSIPNGATVTVNLACTKQTATIGSVKTDVFNTEVKSAEIVDNSGSQGDTIVNTIHPKTEVEIPVTKVSDGIATEKFTFGLKDVTDLVAETNGKVAMKDPAVSVAAKALENSDQTVSFEVADSRLSKQTVNSENSFKLSYEPKKQSEIKTYWYAIAEKRGETEDVSYDETAYLVKVDLKLVDDGRRLEAKKTIWKTVAGQSELVPLPETEIGVTFTNVAMKYAGFSLGLTKQILTTLGKNLPLNDKFSFDLYEGDNSAAEATSVVKGATTDPETGKLNLQITNGKYAKEAFGEDSREKEFVFTLKETPLEGDAANFMTTIEPATVKVTLSAAGARTSDENGRGIYLVTPTVKTVTVNGTDVKVANNDITVTNRYAPNGTWRFKADKFFYGLGEPRDCSFTMQEIERAPEAGEPLANVLVSNDNLQQWTDSVAAADFEGGKAEVVFDSIEYQVTTPKADDADETIPTSGDDRGDHYYLVTETGDDAAKDTTAYVVKVTVAVDKKDPRKLVPTVTELRYADDINSPLNPLTLAENERPAFYNTDTYDLISAASYSVYAASGEPVDQVCYVDPKIIKNLEGRAIKSGEFAFKLIQVANHNDTEGEVISAATNDEFGMVDFDKANNKGTLENPTCLAYTAPGIYKYRVIEDTSKGGMKDQSVLYSDQIITFTTDIRKDETGKLVCADMYYGYWDKAANKNVPFKEQYTDYETQPSNIGDMSKLNPDWHPTITNKARPMDLQVRKTSVTDRDEGLVGATYALYMVNDNVQGDIWLAEATSEEGGWITYKNVSLSTNNLYYFKETAAPAGHTVSEFRSPYFYLVEDATSPNGYTLKYSDTKYFDAANDQAGADIQAEATESVAEVQAVALQNNAATPAEAAETAAAQAEAAATDDTVQPGHSADGNILLTYDKDGGVYDEATQLEVNKLDTRTHEWVEGAKLVIVEKDSGKEVNSWTSGKAPEKLEKTLNVGTTYLLREVEAPGQYRLAEDVEFVIDNYGNVSITKGTENGNAELSDNTITLYDTMMDAEEVQRRNRETTREVPIGARLAQTGDLIPLAAIGLIVVVSLIALAVAARRRRSEKDSDN